MCIGRVGETCSTLSDRSAAAQRDGLLRAPSTEFFPESALRRIAESGEDDFAQWTPDNPVNTAVWSRSQADEEPLRLQHLDRSVRQAATILYAVTIMGMIVAGFVVGFLLW